MDELKGINHWSSDVQLAKYLGVSRGMISIARRQKQEVTSLMKLKILIGLGRINTYKECVEALEICLPSKLAQALRDIKYQQ